MLHIMRITYMARHPKTDGIPPGECYWTHTFPPRSYPGCMARNRYSPRSMTTGPGFPWWQFHPPGRARTQAAKARDPLGCRFFCFTVLPPTVADTASRASWSAGVNTSPIKMQGQTQKKRCVNIVGVQGGKA